MGISNKDSEKSDSDKGPLKKDPSNLNSDDYVELAKRLELEEEKIENDDMNKVIPSGQIPHECIEPNYRLIIVKHTVIMHFIPVVHSFNRRYVIRIIYTKNHTPEFPTGCVE